MTYTKYYLLFNDRCATLVDYKKLYFNTVIAKGLYTIKALVRDQLGMFCGSIAGAHKTDRAKCNVHVLVSRRIFQNDCDAN